MNALKAVFGVLGKIFYFYSSPQEVRLVKFNRLFLLWPVILGTAILDFFAGREGADPEALGWIYAGLITFVVIAISLDLSRNETIFVFVLAGLLWLFGDRMAEWGVPVWTWLHDYLAKMDVTYGSGLCKGISFLFKILWWGSLVWCWAEHRVRIDHNEIVEQAFLRRVLTIPRANITVQKDTVDTLELILGFGSQGVTFSKPGRKPLVLDIVPGLLFRWQAIDRILQRTAVVDETTAAAAADEDAAPGSGG